MKLVCFCHLGNPKISNKFLEKFNHPVNIPLDVRWIAREGNGAWIGDINTDDCFFRNGNWVEPLSSVYFIDSFNYCNKCLGESENTLIFVGH